MEVKGRVEMTMKSNGVTKLHYRGETGETYVEVEDDIVRETSPTIYAYRAFVVGLVQTLREERNRIKKILKENNI